MAQQEDVARAAQSLVFTLKRLEQELNELGALLQDHGRSLYEIITLEDWVEIIGVLSSISNKSDSISKLCFEMHFQIRSSRRGSLS
jgi:hypothetical protein